MDLEQQIEEWSKEAEPTYIIYGSQEALHLFEKSVETLEASDCFDFHIAKYSVHQNPIKLLTDMFPIDGYLVIEEATYKRIHLNICNKIAALLKEQNTNVVFYKTTFIDLYIYYRYPQFKPVSRTV